MVWPARAAHFHTGGSEVRADAVAGESGSSGNLALRAAESRWSARARDMTTNAEAARLLLDLSGPRIVRSATGM